ncbi:MAG: XRE family transcriptional regulator [Bacteroidetes bacterium HGW-Bacteroidetes-12]|nr:MAG: XRE family transcriptional regulator [Bacteroidetes bacterium HGW-Bacteroidetes-12]
MSVGKKIKQLRELRNFTQTYVAKELGMSLGGYSKIERDETDVTITKLNSIAKVLETDISTILNFDSKQVFNQYNNQAATANGIVQNQQIIADQNIKDFFSKLNEDITSLKNEIAFLKKKK